MKKKYKNKYRGGPPRLKSWDYGWNGAYFITICTKNRVHFFGEIIPSPDSGDNNMVMSEIGKMAEKYWFEIPEHFPYVKLGAFVVMPNHIHGIIIIDKNDNVDAQNIAHQYHNAQNILHQYHNAQNIAHLYHNAQNIAHQQSKNKFGPQSNNLASIIRGYKIGVTKNGRKINPEFSWQSRYYDHIIRNKKSFENISKYIFNNPLNWKNDNFFY